MGTHERIGDRSSEGFRNKGKGKGEKLGVKWGYRENRNRSTIIDTFVTDSAQSFFAISLYSPKSSTSTALAFLVDVFGAELVEVLAQNYVYLRDTLQVVPKLECTSFVNDIVLYIVSVENAAEE